MLSLRTLPYLTLRTVRSGEASQYERRPALTLIQAQNEKSNVISRSATEVEQRFLYLSF